ncbi:hypothetical protein BN1708_016121, partial [Verticillium longisporum]
MKGICRLPTDDDDKIANVSIAVSTERQAAIATAIGSWHFCAHDFSDDELLLAAMVMFKHALSMPQLERWRIPAGDNLCYSALGWISEYLNQDNVIEALGAEVSNYESCNFDINRNFLFAGDWFQPFHRLVPGLLEKIPVLIYAGDADYICNWLGNRAWTEALEWPGQKGFNKADIKSLTVADDKKGKEYGKVKSSGNFTFMQIYGAGHMVPMDQPESSSDFFNRCYLPVPSSSAKLKAGGGHTDPSSSYGQGTPHGRFPPDNSNLTEEQLDPYFNAFEASSKDLESLLTGPMEKVNRRTVSHLQSLAADLCDLGSRFNGFALSEPSATLGPAIERVGQAADSSYIATEELAGSLGASFAEPMRESAQFAGVVRNVLKYRQLKRIQQEQTNDELNRKK